MGAPVDTGIENFEEAILKLSISDRARLIGWISETMVEEEIPVSESEGEGEAGPALDAEIEWPPKDLEVTRNTNLTGESAWYDGIPTPADLTEEEWRAKVHEVAGSWKDHPMSAEELIEDIYSSRTISTREINIDD